jgi:hypothetical protein
VVGVLDAKISRTLRGSDSAPPLREFYFVLGKNNLRQWIEQFNCDPDYTRIRENAVVDTEAPEGRREVTGPANEETAQVQEAIALTQQLR